MKAASWTNEPSAETDAASQSGFDIVGLIFRRLWIIIAGGVIGSGLGYLYFTKQLPVYQSASRILVVREVSSSEIPIRGIGESWTEGDSTARAMIRSPLIVGEAVKKHNLDRLPPFIGRGDPTHRIIGGLGVEDGGARGTILDLTYRCPDPETCSTVLKAVISSYQAFLGKNHESVNEETVKLITEAKDSLMKQLSDKEANYRQFRQNAPLLWNGNGEAAQNIHKARLGEIERIRSELRITRTQTKAQLQAIEEALARGENREALSLMTGRVAGANQANVNPDNMSPESQLFPLLLEEQMLLDNHGPDHPKVQSMKRKIEMTRKYLTRTFLETTARQELKDAASEAPQDFLTVYVKSLHQEIKTSEEKERELNLLFEQEREASKALAIFEIKDATYQADLNRTQQLFDGVVKRLEEINLMKNYGGYKMEVISPATAGWQVEPNRNRILSLGLVAGLLGGLALAFVVEISDRSFRSPEDISSQLGMPVLGHIPVIMSDVKPNDSDSKLSPMMVTYFQPKSRLTEAYRAIRTALYFSTRGEKHKVFQVTSPNPGDGKTTLATNLAICIAQSGKSVLLIDADLRCPRVDKTLGIEDEIGMTSVIRGEAELLDAIQGTEVENLWTLPCGPRPDNPAELLSSHRFDELLEVLREKYDVVLIDTPPMLAVTDPGTVAPRVDGVLLTIRISKRSRAEALRATSLLKSLGANLLGVVINGEGIDRGLGYGRGRGDRYYNYRYGYWYGDNGGHYYNEDQKRRTIADTPA